MNASGGATNEIQELEPSDLGTKEHWDNTYEEELKNYEEYEVMGDSWFGKGIEKKLITHIKDKMTSLETEIVDIGCGNGSLIIELAKIGYKQLTALDYSDKAIELAERVATTLGLQNNLTFTIIDMIKDEDRLKLLEGKFDVCIDKGTYDAISLMKIEDDGRSSPRSSYLRNVQRILRKDGTFLLTSCNWTKVEIVEQTKDLFELEDVIESKKFTFGGAEGNNVTIAVLRRKNRS